MPSQTSRAGFSASGDSTPSGRAARCLAEADDQPRKPNTSAAATIAPDPAIMDWMSPAKINTTPTARQLAEAAVSRSTQTPADPSARKVVPYAKHDHDATTGVILHKTKTQGRPARMCLA